MCLVPDRSAGAFAYVDQADQRVWWCDGPGAPGPGAATPRPLTSVPPAGEVHNHGGLSATADGDWVLTVREIHREGRPGPVRSVVALSTRDEQPCETTLLDGHDFFGTPRPHPTADRLAVVAWDHPDMPWDASVLLVLPLARVASGARGHDALDPAGPAWAVAGGPGESVGQPAWDRDGSLLFVSDRRGWWQPYVHPGRPGAGPEPTAADGPGGRVPRSGLGARPAHHRGDARRHGRGADDIVGPGRAHPARSVGPGERRARRRRCGNPVSPLPHSARTEPGWP